MINVCKREDYPGHLIRRAQSMPTFYESLNNFPFAPDPQLSKIRALSRLSNSRVGEGVAHIE